MTRKTQSTYYKTNTPTHLGGTTRVRKLSGRPAVPMTPEQIENARKLSQAMRDKHSR